MLSSGANVIIWDAMLSSGANVLMVSSGANVIIWCYHVMLSSGMITSPFFVFPGNFTHSLMLGFAEVSCICIHKACLRQNTDFKTDSVSRLFTDVLVVVFGRLPDF